MLYDKSIKNCKRGDKMNTKDYIETKKSKKLSDIFKGVLAAGLVVGSMVTSTACKPNQPHESSSSTSKIETTTTTPIIVEDPDKEIKIKRNELINMIENEFEKHGEKYKSSARIIYLTKQGDTEDEFDYSCTVGALFQDEKKLIDVLSGYITKEDYMYLINNIAPNASQKVHVADFIIRFDDNFYDVFENVKESTKNINEIDDEKVLDIILDSFSKSHSQDQQDDLVR